MIRNLDKRLANEINRLLPVELLDNLHQWREAQEQYRVVKARVMADEIRKGYTPVIAEQRASGHRQVTEAIAFTGYYANQVQTCATALLALYRVREDMNHA